MRSWQSRKGEAIEARYVRRVGGLVVLEKTGGGEVRIRPSDLSPKDRDYLDAVTRAENETALARRKTALDGMRRRPAAMDDTAPDYLSSLEWDVILELNFARRAPAMYAEHLKEYRKRHVRNGIFSTERGPIQSLEGLAAVDEAIAFLEAAKPLSLLKPSKGLSLAAADHAKDTGPKGIVSHTGTDESTIADRINRRGRWRDGIGENISYGRQNARAIVTQLIIDDGIEDRGHRKNIFSTIFHTVGVACGGHSQYGSMCVMDFAGGFND